MYIYLFIWRLFLSVSGWYVLLLVPQQMSSSHGDFHLTSISKKNQTVESDTNMSLLVKFH